MMSVTSGLRGGNLVGIVSAKLGAVTALQSSGALPENVNYAVKSSFLLSFLESVPAVASKLKDPLTADRKCWCWFIESSRTATLARPCVRRQPKASIFVHPAGRLEKVSALGMRSSSVRIGCSGSSSSFGST